MTLAPGDPVPDLVAPNQHGEPTTVDTDGPTVLYCYPEDGTPGCATEADQFAAEYDTYRAAGVSVYGLSVDPVASHHAFAAAREVPFDLLADPEGELLEALEVPRTQGRADRTTLVFLDGAVHAVYEGVDPDGHAREVFMDLLDAGVVEAPW